MHTHFDRREVLPIVHIVADGPAGGGTTNVLQLASAQGKAHAGQVHFWSQSDSYALSQAACLNLSAQGFAFMESRLNGATVRALDRALGDLRPKLIHLHGARAAFMALRGHYARSGQARLVYTVRGYHFVHKPFGVRQVAALAERFISSHVDCTVFVSEHDLALARRWRLVPPARRTAVIHNGLDFGSMPAPSTNKKFDLCFVGRLEHQKNPLFLVDILRALGSQCAASLVVAGCGSLDASLRQKVADAGLLDRVTFLGELPHAEALQVLAASRVLVLPSRWEGLPTVALEAGYLGLPVVAAATGGTSEAVAHGETGILIRDFDPSAYAAAIGSLLNDSDAYRRMSETAQAYVRERFDHLRTFAAYEELYRGLATNGN